MYRDMIWTVNFPPTIQSFTIRWTTKDPFSKSYSEFIPGIFFSVYINSTTKSNMKHLIAN